MTPDARKISTTPSASSAYSIPSTTPLKTICSLMSTPSDIASGAFAGQEHGPEQVAPLEQLLRRTLEAHPPALHEDGTIGDGEGDVHRLLDDHHREPLSLEALGHDEQLLHDERRQPEGQLVDEQDPRIEHDRLREREHLLLPAGERSGAVLQPRPPRGNRLDRGLDPLLA